MALDSAIKALKKCETELRSLVATAADDGDYDSVLRITSWAKEISNMAAASTPREATAHHGSPKKPQSPAKYPRFVRRGDQLLKFGWSKREKAEYEHKAPLQVALALACAVKELGQNGRIFQISELLPLNDPAKGNGIPGYQVYLVVAWWRNVGLVDRHGRRGYSIASVAQLQQAVESEWLKLPEDRAGT